MIGLALVSFVTVFAAGISDSIDDALDTLVQGDVIVQNKDGFSPIPASVADDIGGVVGVDKVTTLGYSTAKVKGVSGDGSRIAGIDPATSEGLLKLDFTEGSQDTLNGMKDDEALLDQAFGESEKIDVGDTLDVLTPTGKRVTYRTVGEVKDNADFLGSFVITSEALRRDFGYRQAGMIVAELRRQRQPRGHRGRT